MTTSQPQPITGPAAWKGSEFDFRAHALWQLDPAEVDEIIAALTVFKDGGGDIATVDPSTFPLPMVGQRMVALRRDLLNGPGIILLRGLPRERLSDDDLALAFAGIGCHIGEFLPQSHLGELLGSVIDVSDTEENPRAYHQGGGQGFHTDGTPADVIGLMCLRAAKSGGASRIVSAAAVHNAMLVTRPDLVRVLYDTLPARRSDADAAGSEEPIEKEMAIFAKEGDAFSCYLTIGEIWRAVHVGGRQFTPEQVEALELIQELGASPDLYLDMEIGEGDIQFLNNRTILHGRLPYEDHEEIERRRYMIRLTFGIEEWPDRPDRQTHATITDSRRWLRNRQSDAEMPTDYRRVIAKRVAERAQSGNALARTKALAEISGKHLVS